MIGSAGVRLTGSDRASTLTDVFDLVLAWIERARQRTQLASIDPSLLHDLGLSQADVDAEWRKHFWQS